jgi:hypothetical protein
MASVPSSQPETKQSLPDWKTFLESFPPETTTNVTANFKNYHSGPYVSSNPIQLYCDSEECNGTHWFDPDSGEIGPLEPDKWQKGILVFHCRHCEIKSKVFALYVSLQADQTIAAYKLGEYPPFGPHTPSRVIDLIGPDRELFLKGRRAENRGLGIGAFAYYRRVVENQKSRLIGEMEKVAKKLGAKPEVVEMFERAKHETQFSNAIGLIKDTIPESLLIDGHNPLQLLHTALSKGLHGQDDSTCLELAQSIRVVLTDLAERISLALKEHSELKGAVSKILQQNAKAE